MDLMDNMINKQIIGDLKMKLSKTGLLKLQTKGFYEITGKSFHIFIFKDINGWTVQHEIVFSNSPETIPTWKNMTFNELMDFDFMELIDNMGFNE